MRQRLSIYGLCWDFPGGVRTINRLCEPVKDTERLSVGLVNTKPATLSLCVEVKEGTTGRLGGIIEEIQV